MQFYYPYSFKQSGDQNEMIAMLTTTKLKTNKHNVLGINDITNMLSPRSSDLIIILWSNDTQHIMYNNIIIQLQQKYIIALVYVTNNIQSQQFISNIMQHIKTSCMIKFRINIEIPNISFVGYKSSCKYLINDIKNKIIAIDPPITILNKKLFNADNIHIIFSSNCDKSYSTLLPKANILSDIDLTKVFAFPVSDMNIITSRLHHITQLIAIIIKILN
jgi:hypothetical protein